MAESRKGQMSAEMYVDIDNFRLNRDYRVCGSDLIRFSEI